MNNLSEVQNKHKGKTGFIIGAGWSLNNYNIQKVIDNGISFACNASVMKLTHANYFCMTDSVVPDDSYYQHGIEISDNVLYLNPIDLTDEFNKHREKAYLFNRRYGLGESDDYSFRIDHNPNLINGADVCHVATHLAHIMGCNPIILCGIDLCWDNGTNRYFYIDGEVTNRFEERKYKITMVDNTDCHLISSYGIWLRIKEANPHVNILYGSDGILDIFPKINLKQYE